MLSSGISRSLVLGTQNPWGCSQCGPWVILLSLLQGKGSKPCSPVFVCCEPWGAGPASAFLRGAATANGLGSPRNKPVLMNCTITAGSNRSVSQPLAPEIECDWHSDHKLSQEGNSYMQSTASVCVDMLCLWRKLVLLLETGKMKGKIGSEHRNVKTESQAEMGQLGQIYQPLTI